MYRNRIWSFGDAGERTQRNRIMPLDGPGGFISSAEPLTTTSTRITWTAPSGTVDSYRLERSTDNISWSTVSSGLTTLTADDTGRAESTQYYYRVISVVGGVDDKTSTTSSTWTIPSTPTGLTATAISASQINLAWTDVSTGNTAQIVERRSPAGSGSYAQIATVSATATAYNDESVSGNTTYDYRVAATNPAATSAYATATNALSYPATPVVTVGTVTSSSIDLSWTATGATYTVEWSADGGSSWASVGEYTTNTATSVTDGGLLASTGYDYRVRASNASGNSGYGSASATTSAAAGIASPTYEIDFTTDPYVGTRFSRSSRGTFINSSGYIQVAEQNLALYSSQLTNTYWTTASDQLTANAATAPDGMTTAARLTENSTTGFHGMSRNPVAGVTAGSPHTFSIYVKRDPSSPNARNIGIWLYYDLSATPNSARNGALFNTSTGAYVSQSTYNGGISAYGSENMGNGWFRYWITCTAPSTATGMRAGIWLCQEATTTLGDYRGESYLGNGSSVLYWGPQLVASSSRLPYTQTTTATNGTPRITYDPVTLACRGLLLENSSTNLLPYSDFTSGWTTNRTALTTSYGTSPENATTSAKIKETATTGEHNLYRSVSSVSAGAVTLSVFAKADDRTNITVSLAIATDNFCAATFNLSAGTAGSVVNGSSSAFTATSSRIENAGNGWYRCSVTGTVSATTNIQAYFSPATVSSPTLTAYASQSYAGTLDYGVLVWGAQMESSANVTSYIPTTSASVTRSADTFALFSSDLSFWNASAGSLAMNWAFRGAASANPDVFAAGNTGTNTLKMTLGSIASNLSPYIINTSSSTSTVTGYTGAATVGTSYKSGFAYDNAPNFKGFVNGVAGSNITARTIPTVARWAFGFTGISNMNPYYDGTNTAMTVSRIRYWNTKLSDTDMQTLTT